MTDRNVEENVGFSALEVAADWLDRQDEMSDDERREFKAWLGASDENAQAYSLLRQTMRDTALLDAGRRVQREAEGADRAFAKQIAQLRRALMHAGKYLGSMGWLGGGLAVATLLLVVVLGVPANKSEQARSLEYSTALRERADYQLKDRSRVFLNADSKVGVLYTAQARDLDLERGEAIFEVTKDIKRPFNVAARAVTVTAVGTLFDVDVMNDAVEVRVFKGVVKVSNAGSQFRVLNKGEWLVVDPRLGSHSGKFDLNTFQTWQSDWLEADHMPLPYIVAKLNRYTDRRIVIADKAFPGVALSGRFQLSRTDTALAMISTLLSAATVRRDHQIFLVPRNE